MKEPEILIAEELRESLQKVIDDGAAGVMSYQTRGKWHVADVLFKTLTDSAVHVEIKLQERPIPADIQINQPVGISVQHEFNKYVFEAVVVGFESSVNEACGGKIVLELPHRIERMQRRSYTRVAVPEQLNIKVLFWHRGYMDSSTEAPLEHYWQGKLVNLSAGGMQIAIDVEQGANFRAAQLVGLQFTPMSYQKPMLLEAQVKHLAENAEDKKLFVGVEFIGLEASGEGRKKLRRLVSIADEYEKQNEHAERTAGSTLS